MIRNKDVPPEAIIQHLLKENENLRLQIRKQENMISEFKKWQGKVADYKYSYWLNEGLQLATIKPDFKQIDALRKTIGGFYLYKMWLDRCERVAKTYVKASERLNKTL